MRVAVLSWQVAPGLPPRRLGAADFGEVLAVREGVRGGGVGPVASFFCDAEDECLSKDTLYLLGMR
nr:hypothetical protein StreXyl84_64700 [Streptomyces sp. Xyl84]